MKTERYFFIGILALVSVFCIISCDLAELDGNGTRHAKLSTFMVGTTTETSIFAKIAKSLNLSSMDDFVAFTDSAEFDLTYSSPTDVGNKKEDAYNKVDFHPSGEEFYLPVRCIPETAASSVKSMMVSSSDTSILKVKSWSTERIKCITSNLGGPVTLTVTMVTAGKTITKKYPIQVKATLNLKFRINPYWSRNIATRIKLKTKGLTGLNSMLLLTRDSVAISTYCKWYDTVRVDGKFTLKEYIKRDTINLPLHQYMFRYKKNSYRLLRNITSELKDIKSSKGHDGHIVRLDQVSLSDISSGLLDMNLFEAGYYNFEPHRYDGKVEMVTLYFHGEVDQRFIEIITTTNSKKIIKVINEGETVEEWSDDDGDSDNESIEPEDDDDTVTIYNDEVTSQYFTVALLDPFSQDQKDSVLRVINDYKRSVGYSTDLSDEEKDRAVQSINDIMAGKEPESTGDSNDSN